jgi:3-methyladenine DNA glycosylase AlkC
VRNEFELTSAMEISHLLEEIKKNEHGFKHIVDAGEKVLSDESIKHLDLAIEFLSDQHYQVRMLGTYLLGELSPHCQEALTILQAQVAADPNWRVQEMLAKAFDRYCQANDYEKSLPMIKQWLGSDNPNVKRAVIEGLRIWTGRAYFVKHPETAIELISAHKADESEYLRKSVGNALRDIAKKYSDLIQDEISAWDLTDKKIKFTYKLIVKSGRDGYSNK